MTTKSVTYADDARQALVRGVNRLADAVKITLGPSGRNVILDRPFGSPVTTKDGATVASDIELRDRTENMGARLLREVASKTSEVAGDGSTTATVLAQAIFREGVKAVTAGGNPMDVKRGIDRAVEAIVASLAKLSRPVTGKTIVQVGVISAGNDDTIGKLVAAAMDKVGKDGVITVEQAEATETSLEVVEGMQFDRGYLSAYFVTDLERMECVLEDAYVLTHENKISSMNDLLPLLQEVSKSGNPFLVISADVDGQALATLVVNKLRGCLQAAAVRAPGFGDRRRAALQDIAVLTGATCVTEDLGIKPTNLHLSNLGRAKKIVIDKDTTTLIGGAGTAKELAGRVTQIRSQIAETSSDDEREKLEERLAKLVGGVAVIKVGATTETEMKERKARFEDAVRATKAAVKEGIVPGGGVALLRSAGSLDVLLEQELHEDIAAGIRIVRRALEAPLRQIVDNAGMQGSVVVSRVQQLHGDSGFDARTGTFVHMLDAGIINPTKVTRVALQNAASIAGLMLTTEALVSDVAENGKARASVGPAPC